MERFVYKIVANGSSIRRLSLNVGEMGWRNANPLWSLQKKEKKKKEKKGGGKKKEEEVGKH